jgi:hypothetical protein
MTDSWDAFAVGNTADAPGTGRRAAAPVSGATAPPLIWLAIRFVRAYKAKYGRRMDSEPQRHSGHREKTLSVEIPSDDRSCASLLSLCLGGSNFHRYGTLQMSRHSPETKWI